MNLYAQQAVESSVDGVIIRHITHQDPIDIVLQVVAFYNNMVFIPIIRFDDGC